MKKLLLLLGMIILGAATSLTAMQNRPAAWLALDAHIEDAEDGNWEGVFGVLKRNPNLVNQYRSPDGQPLLYIAVDNQDIEALERLLREFKADPNAFNNQRGNLILKDARGWDRNNPKGGIPGAKTATSLLLQYHAHD